MMNGFLQILTMQMIKKYWIYLVFIISLLVFIVSSIYKKKEKNTDQKRFAISVRTFKTEIGWGYDILVNDSSMIHQDIIPGVQGKKGFNSEEDAAKIGNLVLEKIKQKRLPSITLQELKDYQIIQ